MKLLEKILLFIMAIALVLPFTVIADEEEKTENKEKKDPVKIYIFRSDTCGYCKALMEFLDSIKEEYGEYFEVHDYEVSNSKENADLYDEVASFMGDTAGGVPYMVIGRYTYPNGFGADTVIDEETGKTSGDELIERIMEIYESDERYDVMEELNNKPSYDVVVGIVAGVIIVGIVGMAVITRRNA